MALDDKSRILTINGGSSSIRLPQRLLLNPSDQAGRSGCGCKVPCTLAHHDIYHRRHRAKMRRMTTLRFRHLNSDPRKSGIGSDSGVGFNNFAFSWGQRVKLIHEVVQCAFGGNNICLQ